MLFRARRGLSWGMPPDEWLIPDMYTQGDVFREIPRAGRGCSCFFSGKWERSGTSAVACLVSEWLTELRRPAGASLQSAGLQFRVMVSLWGEFTYIFGAINTLCRSLTRNEYVYVCVCEFWCICFKCVFPLHAGFCAVYLAACVAEAQ